MNQACEAYLTRDGEYVPCGRPAVAIADYGKPLPYPVCAIHAKKAERDGLPTKYEIPHANP